MQDERIEALRCSFLSFHDDQVRVDIRISSSPLVPGVEQYHFPGTTVFMHQYLFRLCEAYQYMVFRLSSSFRWHMTGYQALVVLDKSCIYWWTMSPCLPAVLREQAILHRVTCWDTRRGLNHAYATYTLGALNPLISLTRPFFRVNL